MKRASITVEASFVVPVVVWIIFVFICHALIQSDRVIMELTADRVLEEAATGLNIKELSDVDIIKEKLSNMIMAHSIEAVYFCENEDSFEIEIAAEPKLKYMMDSDSSYCIKRQLKKDKICSEIRGINVIK